MTNVDDVAKVAIGVVIVVALLFLLAVGEALVPERPLLVKQTATLVKIFCGVLFFQLYGDCHCWRRCRRILLDSRLGFCDYGSSIFHVVGNVLVEIIRVVVVEVEML